MNKHSYPVIIKEADLQRFKIRKGNYEMGIPCTMVLRLMDIEEYGYDYCGALSLVLAIFPEIDRYELEKELDELYKCVKSSKKAVRAA